MESNTMILRSPTFSYDAFCDDLFIYESRAKSAGSVPSGDVIVDLDKEGKIVAVELMNAVSVLSNMTGKSPLEVKNLLDHLDECEITIKEAKNLFYITIHLHSHNQELSSTVPFAKECLLA